MKISTKARYALVALVNLAEQAGKKGHECLTLQRISELQDISIAYLEQIFMKLRRADIVRSVRGPGGGYRLTQAPCDIRVIDILLAVEENIDPLHIGAGAKGGQSGSKAQSFSNRFWESMATQVYVFLHGTSLADILENKIRPCQAVPMLSPSDSTDKRGAKSADETFMRALSSGMS